MKTPIIILLVLAGGAAVYFFFIRKPAATSATTTTTTRETGVAALFGTNAMTALFGKRNDGGTQTNVTTDRETSETRTRTA